ncbi:MAG: response regulator [Pseudomonadota bacterium]
MPRIMIVENDAVLKMNLEEMLTSLGYELVGQAETGEQAVETARNLEPDLILMDIILPDKIDGISAAEEIKRESDVAVIFITGYHDEEFVERSKRVAPSGYIVKPFHESEIKAAIEIALYKRKMEKKLHKRYEQLREANRVLEREIKERKNAQEDLRKGQQAWEEIFQANGSPTVLLDIDHCLIKANRAALKAMGRHERDLIGKKCYEVFHNSQEPPHTCPFVKMENPGHLETFEIEIEALGGTFLVSCTSMLDQQGDFGKVIHIATDITERKRFEAELQQTEKMEAIATLAGGIAHQFNNALTPIIGNIELLELEHCDDETTMRSLKGMKTSGNHMAHLIRQLLAYVRGGKYNPRPISLSGFVANTLPLMEHTLNAGVHLETDLAPDERKVKADGTQMQMVLSALIANSNEAIEGPGCIRVSTRNMNRDQALIKRHPGLTPGPYVCLSVEDDGKGMDEETRKRIFDPFFTTHFVGRGLGMASVYGIVKSHSGSITVDSELGKGTVVRIYLPATEAEEEVKKEVVSIPEVELVTGEGTILLIEDDAMVANLTRAILERLDYRVLEARTGREAVEIASTFDDQIDLALLDIKLPDIGGDKVYPLLMESRPGLKVVVFSGYSIDGPVQGILDAGAEGFIHKPFSITVLADKLKDVLERR